MLSDEKGNTLRVPYYISKTLTKKIRITKYNIELYQDVLNKNINGDPCNMTIKNIIVGDIINNIKKMKETCNLEIGWIIERHLIIKDWPLINRQTTLHRMVKKW